MWMRHYGEALPMSSTSAEGAPLSVWDSPSATRWLESDEAEALVNLWQDIHDGPLASVQALTPLLEYGIHVDEVLGLRAKELSAALSGGSGEREHCGGSGTCYGKCGPGCWSIGSLSYCVKHDCCCLHYGSGACYSWCYVNPKCPHGSPCGAGGGGGGSW